MVRGSILLFVVLYSILLLKKRYNMVHWIGLVMIVVGVLLVGWGGIRATKGSEV